MWLLHTKTLELRHFIKADSREVPYAILSHVWEDIDHTHNFQDIRAIHARCLDSGEDPRSLVNEKVRNFCLLAEREGYEWVWLDTCCIDKSSSAELSEAINSMFAWYMDAAICFAYLSDVSDDDDPRSAGSEFRRSRWHTRGWTLQELIAPRYIVFLSRTWQSLGTKITLLDAISQVTKINQGILRCTTYPPYESVACRMSWAAHRSTSRLEDRAYSLLGLFGVTMPIIYGEGSNAFIRLQMEILKLYPDHSIFAWGFIHPDFEEVDEALDTYRRSGEFNHSDELGKDPQRIESDGDMLLATCPSQFAASEDIVPIESSNWIYAAMSQSPKEVTMDCTLTSAGVLLTLLLSVDHTRVKYGGSKPETQTVYAAALACTRLHSGSIIVLFLRGPTHPGGRVFGVGKAIGKSTPNLTYGHGDLCRGAELRMKHTAPSDFTLTRLCLPSGILASHVDVWRRYGRNVWEIHSILRYLGHYELFIPYWVLRRLEARHGILLTRPTGGRSRVHSGFYGYKTAISPDPASAHSVEFAFSSSSTKDIIELRFGVGCPCGTTTSEPKSPTGRDWWLQVSFRQIPLTSNQPTPGCGRWHNPLPATPPASYNHIMEQSSVFNVDDTRDIHVRCAVFTPSAEPLSMRFSVIVDLVGFDALVPAAAAPLNPALEVPHESTSSSSTAANDRVSLDDPIHHSTRSSAPLSPSKWRQWGIPLDMVADHLRRPLTGLRSVVGWLGSEVDYTYGSLV